METELARLQNELQNLQQELSQEREQRIHAEVQLKKAQYESENLRHQFDRERAMMEASIMLYSNIAGLEPEHFGGDQSRLIRKIFDEMIRLIEHDKAVFFREFEPNHQEFLDCQDDNPDSYQFLKKPVNQAFLDSVFGEEKNEFMFFNAISSDHYLYQFYQNQPDFPETGGHFVFVRSEVEEIGKHLLCFYRAKESAPFDEEDLRAVRVLLAVILISQENIHHIREEIRMKVELEHAAALQQALFPKRLPQVENLEISGFAQSSTETGGDWYGFMVQFEGELFVMIGDASGHGTPAALMTAVASATCRTLEELYVKTSQYHSPALFLEHLNSAIIDTGSEQDLNMTFFIARIHLNTGVMTFSNAGHCFPFIVKASRKSQMLLNTGFPLGDRPNSTYTESSEQLSEGDVVCLYTDGLTENCNAEGKMWGPRNLVHRIKKYRHLRAVDIVSHVIDDSHEFLRSASPHKGYNLEDDQTLVVIKVTAPFPGAKTS